MQPTLYTGSNWCCHLTSLWLQVSLLPYKHNFFVRKKWHCPYTAYAIAFVTSTCYLVMTQTMVQVTLAVGAAYLPIARSTYWYRDFSTGWKRWELIHILACIRWLEIAGCDGHGPCRHGTCELAQNGTYICSCDDGWFGIECNVPGMIVCLDWNHCTGSLYV